MKKFFFALRNFVLRQLRQVERLVRRFYRKYWRRFAPLFLIGQIASIVFSSNIGMGVATVMFVTVPCGISIINRKKWLWYPRQAFFVLSAILYWIK